MTGLTDYVKWVAENLGIELDDNNLNKLTIELINCEKYNKGLKELQKRIIIASDDKYFNNT